MILCGVQHIKTQLCYHERHLRYQILVEMSEKIINEMHFGRCFKGSVRYEKTCTPQVILGYLMLKYPISPNL